MHSLKVIDLNLLFIIEVNVLIPIPIIKYFFPLNSKTSCKIPHSFFFFIKRSFGHLILILNFEYFFKTFIKIFGFNVANLSKFIF